jgi:hypothetical protein
MDGGFGTTLCATIRKQEPGCVPRQNTTLFFKHDCTLNVVSYPRSYECLPHNFVCPSRGLIAELLKTYSGLIEEQLPVHSPCNCSVHPPGLRRICLFVEYTTSAQFQNHLGVTGFAFLGMFENYYAIFRNFSYCFAETKSIFKLVRTCTFIHI